VNPKQGQNSSKFSQGGGMSGKIGYPQQVSERRIENIALSAIFHFALA
jgi:hypothetical protein